MTLESEKNTFATHLANIGVNYWVELTWSVDSYGFPKTSADACSSLWENV